MVTEEQIETLDDDGWRVVTAADRLTFLSLMFSSDEHSQGGLTVYQVDADAYQSLQRAAAILAESGPAISAVEVSCAAAEFTHNTDVQNVTELMKDRDCETIRVEVPDVDVRRFSDDTRIQPQAMLRHETTRVYGQSISMKATTWLWGRRSGNLCLTRSQVEQIMSTLG